MVQSDLSKQRLEFVPNIPKDWEHLDRIEVVEQEAISVDEDVRFSFPQTFSQKPLRFSLGEKKEHDRLRVGVVFSGGQAPGGHNVVVALFEALKKLHPKSELLGFLNGPKGILADDFKVLDSALLAKYANQGGFDLLGSGRTKIETKEQFAKAKETILKHRLNGLVIIGGDDSNTNAAFLAEYFIKEKVSCSVVGVPKTIDGDLKNTHLEVSFGFDTATKVYSELVGNVCFDALSAKKYYFFIKLMGRAASHIALECALQTHPNVTLIGEEIANSQKTFWQIVEDIAKVICQRADDGKNYGVILIPEGIVEFIPSFRQLTLELNRIPLQQFETSEEKLNAVKKHLSPKALGDFVRLPETFQKQLLIDRDPHGNVPVSKIESERLFIEAVKKELNYLKHQGRYRGVFKPQPLFFGYEGRCSLPSNFDCAYCRLLGLEAALLIHAKKTGYLASVANLSQPVERWQAHAIPIVSLMHFEERKGKKVPVVKKAHVDLQGAPFHKFEKHREQWMLSDAYRYPGPIQFFGPDGLTNAVSETLRLERS